MDRMRQVRHELGLERFEPATERACVKTSDALNELHRGMAALAVERVTDANGTRGAAVRQRTASSAETRRKFAA
jgi:hypothetical protein